MAKTPRGKSSRAASTRKKRRKPRSPWSDKRREEVVTEVCEHIARGGSALGILSRHASETYPTIGTFLEWLSGSHPRADEWSERYAHARALRTTGDEERLRETMWDQTALYYTDQNGESRIDTGAIQRKRLIIDSLKWILARRDPLNWGDRIDVTTKGESMGAVALPAVVPLGSPLDAGDMLRAKPKAKPRKRKKAAKKAAPRKRKAKAAK